MLNLSGKFNYYLCVENISLRNRHCGLRNYIKGKLHRDPCNGDVYIFLSKDYSRMRLYYYNHGGEILTEKILHTGKFMKPVFLNAEKSVYQMSWSDFVYLLECVIRTNRSEIFEEYTPGTEVSDEVSESAPL